MKCREAYSWRRRQASNQPMIVNWNPKQRLTKSSQREWSWCWPYHPSKCDEGRKPESQQVPDSSQLSHPAEKVMQAIMAAELSQATVNEVEGKIFWGNVPCTHRRTRTELTGSTKASNNPIMRLLGEQSIESSRGSASFLPAMWQMKRKYGKQYDWIHASDANWISIRKATHVICFLWMAHKRQIDKVPALPKHQLRGRSMHECLLNSRLFDGENNELRLEAASNRKWHKTWCDVYIHSLWDLICPKSNNGFDRAFHETHHILCMSIHAIFLQKKKYQEKIDSSHTRKSRIPDTRALTTSTASLIHQPIIGNRNFCDDGMVSQRSNQKRECKNNGYRTDVRESILSDKRGFDSIVWLLG